MPDPIIIHNPNCSTSRHAVEVAASLGISVDERRYMLKANRLSAEELTELAGMLEDPVTDLVRRDAVFKKLGLTEADVATTEQVVAVLADHGELLQRPIIIKDGRAIIGRPKDRVEPFLAS
jgi:arsenate reductase